MNQLSRFDEIMDSDLVMSVLNGNRDAFAALVQRYQSAVCGMAYSVCGNFATSEDVAQESFVAAWRQLAELKDRGRFKGWVCGIARQIALGRVRQSARRREDAAPEDGNPVHSSDDLNPLESAVAEEEKVLVWRTLEALPENYREAMILFYREHQSVSAVAATLGISEETAKQRLSRGRNLLREEVSRRIERVLGFTSPTMLFTMSVMAALPMVAARTIHAAQHPVAQTAGPAAVGGSSLAKLVTPLGAGTLAGLAMGGLWFYAGWRMSNAPFMPETFKRELRRLLLGMMGLTVSLTAFLTWIGFSGGEKLNRFGIDPGVAITAVGLGFILATSVLTIRAMRRLRRFGRVLCEALRPAGMEAAARTRLYRRSQGSFLGIPWYEMSFGPDPARENRAGVARAWFAFGDVAVGGCFAFGGVACAPLAVGGAAVGGLALGGAALGGFALGGMAAGWNALAGLAVAWNFAAGGLAIAHSGALGGAAVAHEWALGAMAFARHANDGIAHAANEVAGGTRSFHRSLPYLGLASLLGLPGVILFLRKLRPPQEPRSEAS